MLGRGSARLLSSSLRGLESRGPGFAEKGGRRGQGLGFGGEWRVYAFDPPSN